MKYNYKVKAEHKNHVVYTRYEKYILGEASQEELAELYELGNQYVSRQAVKEKKEDSKDGE